MSRFVAFISICVLWVLSGHAQDPVFTDGDKYKAILENDNVRVLEYTDNPGEKTNRHHHPDFVLYALDSFKRRLTFGDGKQIEREFKKGDVMWMKDQIHTGENIGTTETHVLIVEVKSGNYDMQDTVQSVPYDNKWKVESRKKPQK
ncbi:MAG: hypothetical protein JW863_09770 [Chitinispirillaceae bacterium]|nr:hypothetical protein [Chitinispirillaceae bacterium]